MSKLDAMILFVFACAMMYRTNAIPAFPTAEGFGANTVGGRGGRVIHVTNLNDDGPGSFRDAVTQTGPRIVVFDVSGTIQLFSNVYIGGVDKSYLTVAGQTSPGGVQFKGPGDYANCFAGIEIGGGAHDVVIRFLRIRAGGPNPSNCEGGIMAYPTGNPASYNIIFDHISLQWSTDDAMQAYGDIPNVIFQWNIIGPGIYRNYPDGGTSVSKPSLNVGPLGSAHHNLLAHVNDRNPWFSDSMGDYRNNIVYNWQNDNAMDWGCYAWNKSSFGNFVNNHYIAGPWSSNVYMYLQNGGPTRLDGQPAEYGGSKIYMEGNWGPNCPTGCADDWDNIPYNLDGYAAGLGSDKIVPALESQFRVYTPYDAPPVTTYPTAELLSRVLPTVGACKPSRDVVDEKVIQDVIDRNGIDWDDVGFGGPWPDLATGAPAAPTDTDGDGMPDAWEDAHALNAGDPSDGAAYASNGYTNVENYLNELAGDPIDGTTGIGRAFEAIDKTEPAVRPNAEGEGAGLRINLSAASAFSCEVFDLKGRSISGSIREGSEKGIPHTVWQPKSPMCAGIYRIMLKADGRTIYSRMVIAR